MKRGLQAAWVSIAILLAMAAIGCGSSSEPASTQVKTASSAPNPRLAKFRFVFQISMICKKGLKQADVAMHKAAGEPIPHPASSSPDWAASKLPVKVVLPAFQWIQGELEKVQPPEGNASDLGNLSERLRTDLKQAEANPDTPVSSQPFSDVGRTAFVYGIHACFF